MNKNYFFLIILVFLSSCQNVKDALSGKKYENSDEFLVIKKNPLVLFLLKFSGAHFPCTLKRENPPLISIFFSLYWNEIYWPNIFLDLTSLCAMAGLPWVPNLSVWRCASPVIVVIRILNKKIFYFDLIKKSFFLFVIFTNLTPVFILLLSLLGKLLVSKFANKGTEVSWTHHHCYFSCVLLWVFSLDLLTSLLGQPTHLIPRLSWSGSCSSTQGCCSVPSEDWHHWCNHWDSPGGWRWSWWRGGRGWLLRLHHSCRGCRSQSEASSVQDYLQLR